MLMKKVKKGFTLIELVVVIAVIAILAAISVISFISVTNKAKESNDHNIIDQINLALKGDAILNKKTTVHNLVENLVEEDGFDVRNLKAEVKDARFVYSYDKHMFGYLKNSQISYPKDLAGTAISSDLWLFLDIEGDSTTKKADLTTGEFKDFSCYVRSTKNVETIKTKEGLDVGKTTGISAIEYINSEDQSVLNRTNSAKTDLSITAPNDTVKHYGNVGSLSIVSIATSSYHEYGTVAFAEINTGRIVLEKDSDINHIHVNSNGSNAFDEVIIQDNGAGELPDKITRDQVDVSTATQVVKVEQNGQSETVYVYPDGSTGHIGTTEKTEIQNTTVESPLGQLVLDNGHDGEKAVSNSEKQEIQEGLVTEAIEKEEREEASEIGICVHNWEHYETITEPTCLTAGEETQKCSLCGATQQVNVPALGHDLIGTYCNRCKHPIAFIDVIPDYTTSDSKHQKVQTAVYFNNFHDLAEPEYPVYLSLDVAYSFKAFPDLDNTSMDKTKSYNLDFEKQMFVKVEDGEGSFSADDIFNYFGDWDCDYYVSFNKDVMPFTCGLGGQYDFYSEETAIGFLAPPLNGLDQPIKGGVDIPLLSSMINAGFSYSSICSMVKEFKCGFFNLSEDNIGTIFTVKLRMTNPHRPDSFDNLFGNYIDVAVTQHVIGAPSEENLEAATEYIQEHPEILPLLGMDE